jgi:large subunit ribosomal protein L23
MELLEVLRRPVISEKNTMLQEQGKYIFEVGREANKYQVKQAVEKAFKVKVKDVNIINVHGKPKRIRGRKIKTPLWKKAIVTLETGEKIQIFEGV